MADARADIIIDVDTSVGIAEIKNLQRQISELNAQLLKSGAQQAKSAQNVQRNLINNINATGDFAARVRTITSTTESFTRALETNKLSMGQYFKYAGASTKTFGRLFKTEFDTIEKVATSRVKTLQTQYIKLGRDANGALKAISVRPLALDMENLATKTAMAAQRQQLFNQLVKQGSTNLLNFGKNTQWAGRQLMVGFTIPLAMMGSAAAKTFMQMEEQAIKFKRVYGDSFTSTEETDKMIKQVQTLAKEFTKYGVAAEKTMEMAASAAAMGLMNADLLAQINESTRLAVLGGVEQQQALDTTISLMSAFGTAATDLAKDIDFLNAVENQTVTAIEDLTIAIPKAAPVIKQLGGDVEDLAFFLTAMKEGGINASEGANALKSGLASLINPTGKAVDFLNKFGISVNGIVEANKGDVRGLVTDFASALDTLDPLNRARAIEQMFGKFQFARLSTLFQNVIKEGTQAERVLNISRQTSEELAILSERELKRVEDSPMYKFKKAVEDIKVSLVPLGEAFLKAITPVIEFAKGFLDRFNEMGEGAKNFAVIATTVVAGIGPVLLMTFGLIANGVANLIKMFAFIANAMRGAGASSTDLAQSTEYMTQQQLEAAAIAASLDQAHSKLIQTFSAESVAVDKLATAYARAVVNQSRLLGTVPGAAAAAGARTPRPKKYAKGVLSVPGPKGAGDIVPAMLSPGEAVIPAKQSQKYAGIIQGMINDEIPGYRIGRNPFASMLGRSRVAVRTKKEDLLSMLQAGKDGRYKSAFETGTGADYIDIAGNRNINQEFLRKRMEEKVFGLGADTPASARPTYGYARTSPIQALINRLFGFKGRQFNSVTSDFPIGDRGKMFGYKDPKTGMFGPTPNYQKDKLARYGDIDLITKRSVGRRSSAAVTDALMDFERSGNYPGFRLSPVSMRGNGNFQNARFDRLSSPFGTNKTGPNSFTSNPQPPYIETYTPGGFSMKEVSKIRVASRSEAKELQKLVDQAGLKIRVTPQNAPMVVKAFANIFGTRFEQGVVSFNGQNFKVASQAGADTIYKTIAMLQQNGVADKRILSQLSYYAEKSAAQGKPLLNAKSLAKKFNLTTTGKSIARGSGKSAAPEWLRLMGQPAQSEFNSERDFLKKRLQDRGISLTDGQLKNALQLQASHINPRLDAAGAKIWTEMDNLVPDLGYVNGYVNDLSGKNNRFMKILLEQAQTKPDALRKKGIDLNALQNISKGVHPITAKEISTLRAISKEHMKFMGPNNPSFYRAMMVDEGLAFRQENGYYKKPVASYAQRVQAGQFKASRKAPVAQQGAAVVNSGKAGRRQTPTAGRTPRGKAGAVAFSLKNILGYNRGVVSVPGPKGAGDVVPAMLSPGEAVIPAEESKKYAPLIQQMVHGKIPGYSQSNVPMPGFGNNGLPLGPDGKPQISFIPPAAVPKLGDKIGAALGASKTMAGALVRGVGNVTKESFKIAGTIVAANAQEKALRMMGTGLGGYVELKDGRIFDQVAQKSYEDKASYDAAQQKARQARTAGTSYTTTSGQTYRFDDDGKAKRLSKAQLEQEKAAAADNKTAPRRGGGFGRFAGTAGMIGSTAGMGMMMSGDPGMQQMGGAVMMGSMLLPMLPMLMNPVGLLAAGLAAAAAATILVRGHFDKLGEETRKITQSLGVGTSAMQKYADFAGKVSASELMDKKRAEAFSPFSIQAGKNPFGATFLQSEEGKGIVDSLKKVRGSGGDAQGTLFRQLSAAISGGSLDVRQARSIAFAIAESLGDQNIGMNINAKLTGLFGVNGENLLKDPLTVQIRQVTETSADLEASFDRFNDVGDVDFLSEEFYANADKATDKARKEIEDAGWGWMNTANDIAAWINPMSWIGKLTTGDAGFTLQGWFTGLFGAGEEAIADSVEAANAYIVKASGAIENYQSAVDALDVNYDKQIEAAKAAGDQAKAEELIEKKAKARNDLMTKYAAAIKAVRAQFDAASETGQTTLLDAAEERILERYKDSPDDKALYEGARKNLETNEISTGNQYSLNMLLNADAITLSTFDWISSNLDEPEITRVMNLNTKLTGKDLGAATSLLDRFSGEKGRENFLAKFELAVDSNAAKDVLSTFTEIANLADTLGEENAQELMDFYVDPANEQQLIDLKSNIDQIKAYDGEKLTVEYIQKVKGGEKFAKIIKGNQKYFDSLDKNQQVIYTQVVMTLAMSDPLELQQDANAYALQNGGVPISSLPSYVKTSVEEANLKSYVNAQAEARTRLMELLGLTEEGGDPEDDGGNEKEDPFKDMLSRLKQIRNAAVNAGGGIKEFLKVLKDGSATTTKFLGTDQKLLMAGYSREFIDSINSMDEETKKQFVSIKNGVVKVTEAGKALKKYFSEVKLGDFQFSLVSGVAAINKQMAAMKLLTGSGMSTADAFEVVQDESLAYAIATAATAEEVQVLVKGFKDLKKSQQEFQFSTPQGTQDWLSEYSGALTNATSKVAEYFDAQRAIVEQDFDTGANKSGRNKDLLNITGLTKQIDDARNQVEEYQFTIDDLEYDLSGIVEKEDVVNKKYDERAEALAKIWKANSDIADQQRSQLDIADALASGDISAAARAIKEEQRRRAEKARDDQQRALEKARENELLGVRSGGNKTRKQLEEEILQLSKKIVEIEEKKIEPVERSLRLAENLRTVALEAIGKEGYLGKTEEGWRAIENAARLAVVQSEAFRESLKGLLRDIPGFAIDDKGNVSFDEAAFSAGIPKPNDAPATSAPADTTVPTDKPEDKPEDKPTLNTKNSSYAVVANAKGGLYGETIAPISEDARVLDRDKAKAAAIAAVNAKNGFVSGDVVIKASSTTEFAKAVMDQVLANRADVLSGNLTPAQVKAAERENIKLMKDSGLKFAKGGMVPSFFGAGGFAKGTDTVPAMLTPGEFVMKRYAVDKYGVDTMKSINNGTFSGDSVYNYNLNVSVKSGANPDDIASAVMSRIKQIDSQRIRSNRY